MKKHLKLWPLFALIIAAIISLNYSRTRTLENIVSNSLNTAIVTVTNWTGSIPENARTNLTEEEFNKIIQIMSMYKYKRAWGEKRHVSSSGEYYFITLECYNDQENIQQTITLTKSGFVKIDSYWYDVSEGEVASKEMVENIHKYIFEILDKG